MKLVGFVADNEQRLGVVQGDKVVDLQAVDSKVPADLAEILKSTNGDLSSLADLAKKAPASAQRPLAGIKYALPVANPGKIVCLGLNYMEHVKEGRYADNVPKFPTYFLRVNTSLTPHNAPMVRSQVSDTFDFEAELALVVGKRAKHLSKDNAYSVIAGWSCFNDGTIREWQKRTTQWDIGKNFDKTGGFGPFFVSADEVPAGAKGLKIESRLNGQVMQSDNTDNMMFPVAETLVDLTKAITLEPGDLIITGTPSGVGQARKPPVFMQNGDTIEIEIEGVGLLSNPIVDEKI
jgi:2-keto-4-pentenoate hydratase/2-oxohepta-3-ene-1,7-dioic acid hydratase in catechol pathway